MSHVNRRILSMAAACVTWAMTREEIGREVRELGMRVSHDRSYPLLIRKFYWVFHCATCQAAWWTALGTWHEGGSVVEWLAATWLAWLWLTLMARVGT